MRAELTIMKVHLMDGVKRGKDITTRLPGKRSERLSIIGALCLDNFFAPMVYQGYCTAKVIETWLEKCLLPKVQIGQVIVMDNAPFHNSSRIRELIENAGCELLFLPSYSPDLNPIEHWWYKVKTAIRKELPKYDFNVHKATDAAFQYL
jgi:transposase